LNSIPIRIQRARHSIAESISEITKTGLEVASATLDAANEAEATALIHDLTSLGAVRESTAGDSQRLKDLTSAVFPAVDEVAVAEHQVGIAAVVQVAVGDAYFMFFVV
jgi:hypothetical protein